MSDINNVGGEPADKKAVTETPTGASPQAEPAENNSADPVAGDEAEATAPSAKSRRARRGEAKQTGKAKKEAAQSPIGGGGKASLRAKDAKAKRELAKAADKPAKKAKKVVLAPLNLTPDEERELARIEPSLKAFARNDVKAKFDFGDLLIQVGAILPYGHFEPWVTKRSDLGTRYVRQIRQASEAFREPRRQLVYAAGLGFTCILALSVATEAVQDDVLKKAADGARYRVADIKAAIEEAKPEDVKKAEAEAKAQPKPERPGLAGLRAEIARHVTEQASSLFKELKAIGEVVEKALNPYREGRSVKKAELSMAVKGPALHALVLQRELMGRKTGMDFPNAYHPVKYGDWPENSRWGDVAKALLVLVELDRHKKSETFARDLEFDVLEPLTWALSAAATVAGTDNTVETGDTPSAAANDDDEADEAA